MNMLRSKYVWMILVGACLGVDASRGTHTADSEIHGTGLFASRAYVHGEHIILAVSDEGTFLTRDTQWINHCVCDPSTELVRGDGFEIYVAARRDLHPGDEITINYSQDITFTVVGTDGVQKLMHMTPPEENYSKC